MALTSYAIALGSNRRSRHGSPAATVRAAAAAIGAERLSRVRLTPALGPAGRGFANAVALVESDLDPPALLARLKQVERDFGRRRFVLEPLAEVAPAWRDPIGGVTARQLLFRLGRQSPA